MIKVDELLALIKKIGVRIQVGKIPTAMILYYEERDGKILEEVYLKHENKYLRELILEHPNCPKELKVAEEL